MNEAETRAEYIARNGKEMGPATIYDEKFWRKLIKKHK